MTRDDGPTEVFEPRAERLVVWIGFPLVGAFVGWLIGVLADWAARLTWGPWRGLLKAVDELPEPQATIGAVAIGAVAGLTLAGVAARERLTVTVTDDTVRLTRGGPLTAALDGPVPREIARAGVTAVFPDRKRLVLLGADDGELARELHDLPAAELKTAFTAHGYPWHDEDPHAAEFRAWVEESPDLPPAAHALLRARRRALEKNKTDDAAALRGELARLGVVVREERKRQFWRLTRDAGGSP